MKEVAYGLASLGRGPDTMLVHMSPREVSGLQSLALAAGGSLTINPHTGLPEAGFLDSLLPTLVGGVLGVMSGGLLLPVLGGALTQGVTSGDWSLGNLAMGGLGGFGGAGLAGGLAGAASQAGAASAAGATEATAAGAAGAAEAGAAGAAGAAGTEAALLEAAKSGVNPASMAVGTVAPIGAPAAPVSIAAPSSMPLTGLAPGTSRALTSVPTGMSTSGLKEGFNTIGRNFNAAFEPGIEQGIKNIGGNMTRLQQGALGMSTLNALSAADSGYGGKYSKFEPLYFAGANYDPRSQTYGSGFFTKDLPFGTPNAPRPFDPYYRDKKKRSRSAAEGGSINAYADGGDVESATDNRSAAKQYFEGLLNPANPMPNNLAPYDAQANQAYMGGIKSLIAPKTTSNLGSMGIVPEGVGVRPDSTTPVAGQNSGVLPNFGNLGNIGNLTALGDYFRGFNFSGLSPYGGTSRTFDPVTRTYSSAQPSQYTSTTAPTAPTTLSAQPYPYTSTAPTATPTSPLISQMDYFQSPYRYNMAMPKMAAGGNVNEYAAGGKLLRGPGDGMSDDIKANIEGEQEARLADGEFVMPADVVSHFGNGSTEAGAKHLYKVMDEIRMARTGTTKQAPEIDPNDFLNV